MTLWYVGSSSIVGKYWLPDWMIIPFETGFAPSSKIVCLESADSVSNILNHPKDLSNRFDYVWFSPELAKIFLDKNLMKEFLSERWVIVSKWFKTFWNKIIIKKHILENNIGFPFLLKEIDNCWWQWIHFVKDQSTLDLLDLDESKEYLLEEFISWDEYSIMLFVFWDNLYIFPPIIKWKTGVDENWKIIHPLARDRTNIIDPRIDKKIRTIATKIWKIKWFGWFFDIDFIYDESKGQVKFIELNPRVSWITDISISSTNYSLGQILQDVEQNRNPWIVNLWVSNIMLESPIIHKTPDFDTELVAPDWWKIIQTTNLRKYPPYLQKSLIEFEDYASYEKFLNRRN